MKKRRITPIIASAVSLSMLCAMTMPVSALYGGENRLLEEREDVLVFEVDDPSCDHLTLGKDIDNWYYWRLKETDYIAVTLEEGTVVPEAWNVTEPEIGWNDNPYIGLDILPWKDGVFDYSEFDENTIVLTDVTDASSLYQTEGVTDVYEMESMEISRTSLGGNEIVVFEKPGVTLSLEDFSSIPEVTGLEEKTEDKPYCFASISTDVSKNDGDNPLIEEYFRLTKAILQIDGVNCAYPSFIQDYHRLLTNTYTLTRIADPDAYGDIDNDGAVNADDAYRALAYYAEQSVNKEDAKLTAPDADKFDEAAAFCAADVNSDGIVNGDDAYGILCYYAAASVGKAPDWNSIF